MRCDTPAISWVSLRLLYYSAVETLATVRRRLREIWGDNFTAKDFAEQLESRSAKTTTIKARTICL